MTIEERKAAFNAELLPLLAKYSLGMIGTDVNEGTFGEITIFGTESPLDTESGVEWEDEFSGIYHKALEEKYPMRRVFSL